MNDLELTRQISVRICGAPFHVRIEHGIVTAATFGTSHWNCSLAPAQHWIRLALIAYDQGDLTALDLIETQQISPPFQAATQTVMRTIPAGETISYAQLAAAAGRPRAIRAAAAGCAKNSIPLLVPCHRIVSSHRRLCGYAFGIQLKRRLLAHEHAAAANWLN